MPSQCRADDGTERGGRYDRRMDAWVPLFAAFVAAVAALGVALLNNRGESAELRQLKALNEVITGMPASAEKVVLERSRDMLAKRVARWVRTAPTRRRQAFFLSVGVVAIAAGTLVLFLIWPDLVESGWDSAAAVILTSAVGLAVAIAFVISGGNTNMADPGMPSDRKPKE